MVFIFVVDCALWSNNNFISFGKDEIVSLIKVGPINVCCPTTGSTKSNHICFLSFLCIARRPCNYFVYQNTQSYLLLSALLISSVTTILSIHIFISSLIIFLLEEETLFTDVVFLFFIFCFVTINDRKTHKPTPDLHKLTSTTKIYKNHYQICFS